MNNQPSTTNQPPTTVRIQAYVPRTDYDELFYRILPTRGCQQIILKELFTKFLTAVKSDPTISDVYQPENLSRALALLSRCTFSSPDKVPAKKSKRKASSRLHD